MVGLGLFPSLCLMAGLDQAAADFNAPVGCNPTRLDYVVLASLADSPNWMSLSAFPGRAFPGRAYPDYLGGESDSGRSTRRD
jgi:hypothetical protein